MSTQRLPDTLPSIIQAPMAGVQDHSLTVAVCNAGGLGSLPCAMLSPQVLRTQLLAIEAQTDRPYNVNFFCHVPLAFDAECDARWRAALAPYYAELGIDVENIGTGPARTPFQHDVADVLEEFRPPVVSFHFGLPTHGLLARVRGWGSVVLATATSVEEGRWLAERGVDAIAAQGVEAGGHRGHFLARSLDGALGTLDLIRQLAGAVRTPLIAAGGIGDADDVAKAMRSGAAAVQVGTAYLLCPEARTNAVHRAALQGADAGHTALTNLFSGRPARGIVNRLMRELGPISPLAPEFPLAAAAIAPLRAAAESRGSGDFSPLWAGQNAKACRAIPAAQLTRELARQLTF